MTQEGTRPPSVPGYRLEVLLGRGGSGEVWRAVPRAGGPPVAVKVLAAGDPERQAREAALLGELDHPHLVRLREVVHQPRHGGRSGVALVLDLLAGGSLSALLSRRGRLRPGEVVTTLAPVAAALAHAHAAGVVHGDLSPGNIVFTAEGRPVLTDLGVARVLGEAAAEEVTPAYVDPTVARGGAPGPASDVFGLAAAAFHALTGIPPWNAADAAGRLRVAAEGELPDLDQLAPDVPPELRAVVARGLSAEPAERGTAAEFALDLRHACRPEPVRLPQDGVPDEELGRTGRGPRTELTHQVPGRHRPRDEVPAVGSGRLRTWSAAVPRLRRYTGAAVVCSALIAAAIWSGLQWAWPGSAGRPPVEVAGSRGTADGGTPAGAQDDRPAGAGRPPAAGTSGGVPSPGPATGADPEAETDWSAVLAELYARRAAAFRTGSPDLLVDVHAPGSPMLAADRDGVAGLVAGAELLRGFAPVLVHVDLVQGDAGEGRAVLEVVDRWPPYEVVPAGAPDGPALRSLPGRGEERVRITVRRAAGGWRIEDAERRG